MNQAVQNGGMGREGLEFVREQLGGYVRRGYGGGGDEGVRDGGGVQNKLTQTLTYLFMALYAESWTGFFDEFRALAVVEGRVNEAGAMLYLRIVGSVHDEIADVMIPRTPQEQKLRSELKDLVRARDVGKIALTWQEILSRWREVDSRSRGDVLADDSEVGLLDRHRCRYRSEYSECFTRVGGAAGAIQGREHGGESEGCGDRHVYGDGGEEDGGEG